MSEPPIDPGHYRSVLGNFPTGVTVVTADTADGPAGMAIGSFTSVSLDPPLVGFLPGKSSASWERMSTSDSFCVNVLAAQQEDVCGVFASKAEDKFAGVEWERATHSGSPIIGGSLAWMDCAVHEVVDAGDHWFVMGRVLELWAADDGDPLIFFKGRYATLASPL